MIERGPDGEAISDILDGADVAAFVEQIEAISAAVGTELGEAIRRFPEFNSPHEGLAVIMEEFDELKAHVYANTGRTPEAAAEAIQVAAMAMRYVLDLAP